MYNLSLARQCLSRRIATAEALDQHVHAWQCQRNTALATINWCFTTTEACIKLKRLYPSLQTQDPCSLQENVAKQV
ncbi:MAG: hypothetical protein NVSMB49_00940 [Ktedonobacteraceae bacterium]